MSSSTSSSEPAGAWRSFLRLFAATATGAGLALWLLVVTIDPWGMLPLSPPLPRVPISTNARYSMPALAISPAFDAAIVGTSTSRLLRPSMLDRLLGARFVNLSMNSATPQEQMRMIALFIRHHPAPKVLVVGLDSAWCLARADTSASSGRSFPGWMYGGTQWLGYLHMANLYAVQEAANQAMVMIGAKRRRYGLDGYTDFLPPDGRYDPGRVDAIFRSWGLPSTAPARSAPVEAATLAKLADALRPLPPTTTRILYLPPLSVEELGVAGSWVDAKWRACRTEATRIARAMPNSVLVDFSQPGPIIGTRSNFWDPVHYRVPVANQVMQALARAATGGGAEPDGFGRVLAAPGDAANRTPAR